MEVAVRSSPSPAVSTVSVDVDYIELELVYPTPGWLARVSGSDPSTWSVTVELSVMWTVRRVQVASFLALTAPHVPVELCAVSLFLRFGCLTRSYRSPTQKVLLLLPSFTDELVQRWVGGVGG